jgi:hypothetical protein
MEMQPGACRLQGIHHAAPQPRKARCSRLETAPFADVIVPGFLQPEGMRSLNATIPAIDKGGSFPLDAVDAAASAADELDDGRGEPWAAFTSA